MHSRKFTFSLKKLTIQWGIFELLFWGILVGFIGLINWIDDTIIDNFTILQPKAGWWLILLPIYYALQIYWIIDRNKKIKCWLGENNHHNLFQPAPQQRIFWRVFLIRNIIVFIIFTMMQPAFGKENRSFNAAGIELVFALDISNSMNVRDIEGGKSRLDLAKKIMQQTIGAAPVAKVGILVFAGSVYPHLPLTPDKRAAKVYTQKIETDIISHQGTNLGLALLKSAEFFSKEPFQKLVVLITDGEDHEGMLAEGLMALQEIDATLFIYGIGTENGGLVPVNPKNKNLGYLKDEYGNPVHSKLNQEMIVEIAKSSKGKFNTLSSAFPDVSDVLTVINNKKATNTIALSFEIEASKYNWPLSIALIFSLIFFIHELRLNWTKLKK